MPSQVTVLNLASNNITENGLKFLCQGLASNQTRIREINLSENFLHFNGCKHLIDALIENQTLRKLSIASNFIKCEGAECLSFMLGLETCLLEELDISDNFISNRGA